MGYASYSESIAERFNERLSELQRVAAQVKRGPTTGGDLSIALQEKLREILNDLATLMTELVKNLDDPSVVQKLSAKSLSDAHLKAVIQSEQLDENNRALRAELDAAKRQAKAQIQDLKSLHDEIGKHHTSNAKLRRANKEAKEAISKLQNALKRADAQHSTQLARMKRDIATVNRKNEELVAKNQELEEQHFENAFRDVRLIKKQ